MNRWLHPWNREVDGNTASPNDKQPSIEDDPVTSNDWGKEITVYLSCRIQQHCSDATIEYRRSEYSLHSRARNVDIGVRYPTGSRERFEVALDALGQHWPIHGAMEQPVYLLFLSWNRSNYFVHIYDQEQDLTSHTDEN